MADDIHHEPPTLIRRFPGFYDLYADSGVPVAVAPQRHVAAKFNEAAPQMDNGDLSAIRTFDRARSGGFVRG